tara:strand:- start:36 stop:605 length:570 start_codon:yes stop_codon:yes gene_type:complete
MKKCTKCGVNKELVEYYQQSRAADKLYPYCKACAKNNNSEYRKNNSSKIKEYRQKNRIYNIEKCGEWRQNNSKHRSEYWENYYTENIISIKNAQQEYRKQNKDKINFKNSKRRAELLHRIPAYANMEAIKKKYRIAQILSSLGDTKYEVDHIIPLRGKTVSGLHVESNLQILSAKNNREKSNIFKCKTR